MRPLATLELSSWKGEIFSIIFTEVLEEILSDLLSFLHQRAR